MSKQWSTLHQLVVRYDDQESSLNDIGVLVKHGNIDLGQRTSTGNTALHLACVQDSPELVDLLICLGASLRAVNSNFESPLHHAVMHGNVEVVTRLLEADGDLDIDGEDMSGCTPLHWALQQMDVKLEVIEALIDAGAMVNAVDNDGNTLLHYAAIEGCVEALEMLLEANANPLVVNRDGLTAFHSACAVDQAEVVEKMISFGAPFNATMPSRVHRLTPLHLATKVRRSSTMRVLLASHEGSVDVVDAYERTPLHVAAKVGNSMAAARLLDLGACEVSKDSFGHSPRWYAKKPMDEFVKLGLIGLEAAVSSKSSKGAL